MNTTGKKFGGRQKGTPNKLNSKIKDKLSDIISDAINTLDIEDMTKAERLKLIQLGLPYIITKPQQEEIQEQHNITVEIIDHINQVDNKTLNKAIDVMANE
jgi:hypothetical protein